MVDSGQKAEISSILETFCPLSFRFYESSLVLNESRRTFLGFQPAAVTAQQARRKECMDILQESIQQLLPTVLPGPSFATTRNELRMKIQQAVISSGLVPPSTLLNIFGSSQNNFGSEGADMDMCLSYPGCESVTKEEKARIIEAIAEFLGSKMGMLEVQARSTARIPIVIFKDSETGIDCGIFSRNCFLLISKD
jgi:terminal uridylyltransferase